MCSISLFLLSFIFILPVKRQFCQSRAVHSSDKEGYNEFGTTEDGFAKDHTEGFDIYDVTNTITEFTDEIYIGTSDATSFMNGSSLKDDEYGTNSVNLTETEPVVPNFLQESDKENVTANISVTDEMEPMYLSTTDSSLQMETKQSEDVPGDWEYPSPAFDPLSFNTSDFADYEEFLSTDLTIKGSNDTVLPRELIGNISAGSYMGNSEMNVTVLPEVLFGNTSTGIPDVIEIVQHFLDESKNSAWSDVVDREEGREGEKEDTKRKKLISDILGNGIKEIDLGCGIPENGHHSRKKRVVGGIRTIYGQLPWLVSLRFREAHPFINKSGFNHLCGANLIHPRWLLTAAHCFNDNVSANAILSDKKSWYAVLGENSLSIEEETQKVVEIDKIIAHELFSYPDNIKPDVALVRLSQPITETEYIKCICLDRENIVFPGEICTVAGWGMHSYNGNSSAYPFQTTLTVLSTSQCEEKVKHLRETISLDIYAGLEKRFCANSDNGKDTCTGDSGGPFQCYRNGRWYLTGVTSAGYGCGQAPGIYARVGSFIDWIDKNMREN